MTAWEYCEEFADLKGFWNPDKACQAYIIALGCNEYFRNDPIGTLADVDFDDYKNNRPTRSEEHSRQDQNQVIGW